MQKIIASLKAAVCAFLPSCREASRMQSEVLDTKLCASKRIGLSLHLLVCKWCRRYGKQIRFLKCAAHEHEENLSESVPQRLSSEAKERIKRRLQAGSEGVKRDA